MVAIFTYGFDIANSNFKTENIVLHTLSNYKHLLVEAADTNYINQNQLIALEDWNNNPAEWNAN